VTKSGAEVICYDMRLAKMITALAKTPQQQNTGSGGSSFCRGRMKIFDVGIAKSVLFQGKSMEMR